MFPIPLLNDCVQRVRAAFFAEQQGLNAWLWPNNIGPSAKVFGGEVWNLFNRLDFVGKQAFALYAVGSHLDDQGSQVGVTRKAAQAASGKIVITATAALAVAVGATFQRGDGTLFAATTAVSQSGAGALNVPVLAATAGLAGVTLAATPMTVVSGVSGAGSIGATAAVDSSGLSGGTDLEADGPPLTSDLSTYRGRILFRKRNPPQGGSASDYVQWATAIPGVTRLFVERSWPIAGGVRVFPFFDTLFAANGGIPDAAHVTLVDQTLQPYVPAGAALITQAALPQTVSVTVTNLNPNTPASQAAVVAEVQDAIIRLGRATGNNSPYASMPYLATAQTFLAIWIEQAVADAAGVLGADAAVSDTVIPEGYAPVASVTFA